MLFNNRLDFLISLCIRTVINTGPKASLRVMEPSLSFLAALFLNHWRQMIIYSIFFFNIPQRRRLPKLLQEHISASDRPYSQGIKILISLTFQLISSFLCNRECVVQLVTDLVCSLLYHLYYIFLS